MNNLSKKNLHEIYYKKINKNATDKHLLSILEMYSDIGEEM